MIKSVDIKILITLHCKYLLLFTAILHLFLYIRPEEPSIQPPHNSDVVILVARPHSVPPPLHLGPDVAAPVVLLLRLAPKLYILLGVDRKSLLGSFVEVDQVDVHVSAVSVIGSHPEVSMEVSGVQPG